MVTGPATPCHCIASEQLPLSHQESQPVHRQSARRPPEGLRRLRVGHYRVVRISYPREVYR